MVGPLLGMLGEYQLGEYQIAPGGHGGLFRPKARHDRQGRPGDKALRAKRKKARKLARRSRR